VIDDVYELISQFHAAFRFVVTVDHNPVAAFTECTLPTIEWEVEPVKEGGLNTYVHQLPGRRKPATLTLKNGIGKSILHKWYIDMMNESFSRKDISITLLDVHIIPVATWVCSSAYPTKWEGPQLKSDGTSVAIQSLDFACGAITFDQIGMGGLA